MKEAGPFRKLAAIALGSLTVMSAMLAVAALSGWVALSMGASSSAMEWVMLACAAVTGAWLSPLFFASKASRVVYGFWLRHVAGLEW